MFDIKHRIKLLGTKIHFLINSIVNYKHYYEFLKLDERLKKDSIYLLIHYKYWDIYNHNVSAYENKKFSLSRKLKNHYIKNIKRSKIISSLALRLYKKDYLENVCWYKITPTFPFKLELQVSDNLVFKRPGFYWSSDHIEYLIEQDKFLLFKLLFKYEENIINH